MNIYKTFIEIEKQFKLFNLKIDDYPIWGSVRHIIYNNIIHNEIIPGVDKKKKSYNKFFSIIKSLYYCLVKNPFLLKKDIDILFWNNPRRQLINNKNWDIYTDPIIDTLSGSYKCVSIEKFVNWDHAPKPYTKKIAFEDAIFWISKFSIKKITIQEKDLQFLLKINKEINKKFEVEIDIIKVIKSFMLARAKTIKSYEKILDRIKPKLIFLVCSYGREILVEAAKSKKIPTVELQHGYIHGDHIAYNTQKTFFPDYLFSFGSFWSDDVDFPVPKKNIFNVGFPFLENNIKNDSKIKKSAVVLSQWTIGKKLAEEINAIAEKLEDEWTIYYKLHPAEYNNDQYEAILKNTKIKIIRAEIDLYELFNTCEYQIGVYSMALFEGLRFGCKTLIIDLPGHEHLSNLLNEGVVIKYKNINSFDEKFKRNEQVLNSFFKLNSNQTIKKFTDEIIKEKAI